MNDNQTSSKSKRRRQRRKNRKVNENVSDDQNTPSNCDNSLVLEHSKILREEYLVHSPAELQKSSKGKPVKSKSLDDDDMVKIQELSEASESEDKEKETEAIVTEASESEVEWEDTMNIPTTSLPLRSSLSTLTLPLESYVTDQVTLMSPEEEKTLRNFLETLNLVNGPEEAANHIYERNTAESIKQRKAKKRAALEQYFSPLCQNPRFLDAISEEASDRDSDKEQQSLTKHLKRGTPELELPPKVPPRLNRERRQALPEKFAAPVEQAPAILVDTKLIENNVISEGYCSTVRTEEASASTVEVVFLTSSGTDSPEELQSSDSDSFEVEPEKSTGNKGMSEVDDTKSVKSEVTHKSDHLNEQFEVLEELSGSNETFTTTCSTPYDFSLNCNRNNEEDHINTQKIIENGLLSQLTPPPTPENLSPKYKNIIISDASFEDPTKDDCESEPVAGTRYKLYADKDLNGKPIEIVQDCKDHSRSNLESSEVYTNVVTPPPPSRSSSSSRSSSRESSQCTARYNPSTSSIIDEISFFKEEDEPRYTQPLTLRELCLMCLMTLPHGKEVLQELAEVSEHLDSYTRSLPSTFLPKIVPNIAHFSHTSANSNFSCNLSVQIPQENLSVKNKGSYVNEDGRNNNSSSQRTIELPVKTSEKDMRIGFKEEEEKEDDILAYPNDLKHTENLQINTAQEKLEEISNNQGKTKKSTIIIPSEEEESTKERNVAITIEKENNTALFSRKNEFIKEKIIPISIGEETGEITIQGESIKERNIPITIEKDREVLIPIQKEWLDQNNTGTEETEMNNMNKGVENRNKWFGLATEKDPNLLVCLSPKQKEELDKTRKMPDEAGKLLELHEKYINRKTSHEEFKKVEEERDIITNVATPACNRLLTIIKEEPTVSSEDSNYLYFVEKEPKTSSTLPRSTENARLNARDLTEWLKLARNKSMSESNLSTASSIPENNLRNHFDMQSTPTVPRRRTSLPHDLYEKQMLYIQEKEREIQRQIQELEEEKKRMNVEMEPMREFNVEDYYFSQKGDFAESRKRHSMPVIPTEIFRQQMYEEYMDKFAEREERKQHKVIKVTSTKDPNPCSEKAGAKEIVHPVQLEDEFMDKVKQKQKEGKLEKVRSLEKDGSVVREEEEEPVLVIDGEELKEARELPKHLQEFVEADGES
ncbi:hypothetical protein JTB14_018154 [Gonioctena quinquepunctata]|nr:hypothetical protein JTB14_018154 [Gonioctena quinquepunctata]